MKKIFLCLFFILLKFIASGNSLKNVQSLSSGSNYGIFENKVYKLNSAGNIAWIRNFSGKIDTLSADTNFLTGIAFDGNLIYVQVIQGIYPSLNRYPSLVILDTLGNVRIIRSGFRIGSMTTGLGGLGCIPSFHGGAWLVYAYNTGISNVIHLIKVDSTGQQVAASSEFKFQTFNILHDFITLHDSTYLFLISTYDVGSMGWVGVIKMDDDGNIIWGKRYNDSGSPFASITPHRCVSDSSENIYLFGDFLKTNIPDVRGNFGLKLSSDGSILLQKEWENSGYFIDNILYSNDSLLLQFEDGFFMPYFTTMDTLLNTSCFDPPYPSGISFISQNNFNSTLNGLSTNTIAFTPGIDTSISLANVIYDDYCLFLTNHESTFSISDEIKIFPNPAHEQIIISSNSQKLFSKLFIFDLNGKLLIQEENYNINFPLKTSQLKAGFYLLQIKTGNTSIYKTLILE